MSGRFTYTMVLDVVKIQDTGKGGKSVVDALDAVLKKIEHWHQGPIAAYRIMYLASDGIGRVLNGAVKQFLSPGDFAPASPGERWRM